MPDYRIYALTPEGHIEEPPRVVACATDQDAIKQARQLLYDKDFEVWEGPRLVTRINLLD
jgi:hypothetical protein